MDAGLFLRRQRQGPLQTNTTEGNDPRAWRNLGANSSTRLRGAKKNGGGKRSWRNLQDAEGASPEGSKPGESLRQKDPETRLSGKSHSRHRRCKSINRL